ncbi:signal peptidase I [Mariniblastus sp.]|nr:signal peptidase I [Mariniblastus sp.]
MESDFIKPRRPWLAGLLGLFGGIVGQIYAGHLKRAIVILIVCTMIYPLGIFLLIKFPFFGRLPTFAFILIIVSTPLLVAADAYLLARRDCFEPIQPYQRWWVYLLAFLVAGIIGNANAYLVHSYVTEAFMIPHNAMAPAVQRYDRILVDKFLFDASQLERNDLVMYQTSDPDPQNLLTHVMGLPGETVEIREEKLLINGKPVPDKFADFIDTDQPLMPELTNHGPVTIPAGSFFTLGDNRRNAIDSRMRGPVPAEQFQGFARLVYWSNDSRISKSRPYGIPETERGDIRWNRIGKRLDQN